MKHTLTAMMNQSTADVVNNLNREQHSSLVQDSVHIATKLRNRLLKPCILLPMGSNQVSVAHLKILINVAKKDEHGLVLTDVCPDDRQNYKSFEKITEDRVLQALEKYVPDSESTIYYLKMCKAITKSFIDRSLEPLQRVYMIWHSLYFIRAWRKWIATSANFDVNENFISQNAFTCIELNAYALLHLICKFREAKTPTLFLPGLFSSQPCESTFRQLRSLTTANWTKINFSLLEVLHMIRKIEMQNDLAFFKLAKHVAIPRIQNQELRHQLYDLPSNTELNTILKKAMEAALRDAKKLGMNDIKADDFVSCELKKGTIPSKKITTVIDPPDPFIDSTIPSNSSGYSYLKDYSSHTQSQTTELDGNGPFVSIIHEDGSSSVVRKQSIVWCLKEPTKLSNDRLKRVQTPSSSSLSRKRPKNVDNNGKEIRVGEWCIFKSIDDLLIGCVLGFKLIGNTQKEKIYGFDFVCLPPKTEVEALATWYKFTKTSILSSKRNYFLNINGYLETIQPPKVAENSIEIDESTLLLMEEHISKQLK